MPKGRQSAAVACLGLRSPFGHSWLPTCSLYSQSEEERIEDTSRDNGDTGIQGHQSAGAKIKAIPPPLPAQTCHQILEEGVSLRSQYFFSSFLSI